MKNQIKQLLACFILALFFISCSKDSGDDGPGGCIAEAERVSTSLNAYLENPTVDNCKAYVASLRNYLDGNACFGNVYYEAYKEALDDLNESECQ